MLIYLFAVFAVCFALERVRPGWRLPQVPTWATRVVLLNLIQLGVVLLAGRTWEAWLASASLLRLRWRHEVDWLWRGFHQIHHSPQRIEVITSFYKHPGEMIVNSILGSLLVYALLGLSLEAGAVYTACTALGEFFYHTNVTTPRWIGFVFQRPEMHRIHHQHGRHRNNYGDIVWWDMLFGTYENPARFEATCGFDDAKENRLLAMLAYRDVHLPD